MKFKPSSILFLMFSVSLYSMQEDVEEVAAEDIAAYIFEDRDPIPNQTAIQRMIAKHIAMIKKNKSSDFDELHIAYLKREKSYFESWYTKALVTSMQEYNKQVKRSEEYKNFSWLYVLFPLVPNLLLLALNVWVVTYK